jgi:putative Mn2+ efflux pump MntP
LKGGEDTDASLFVLGTLSVACLVSGAFVAHASGRYPTYAKAMEFLGGILLIGGLAMLGIELSPIAEAVNF